MLFNNGNTLEEEYTNIVLNLRKMFESSVLPSSDRWYSETQPLELAYVPAISGAYFPVAYSIPFYKIYDTDISRIARPMLPCEMEPIIINEINKNDTYNRWINALKKLGEIKLHLQRYHQVLQVSVDPKCKCNLTSFVESLVEQIYILWEEFSLIKELVAEMLEEADVYNSELLNIMWLFFDCHDDISLSISTQRDPSEFIEIIDKVSAAMVLTQSFAATYGGHRIQA